MKRFQSALLSACVLLGGATAPLAVLAQDRGADETLTEIVVVGSRIKGVADSGALPVTVVSREALDVFGSDSTGDLLANIPSVGDFEFRDNNTGTNGARGDVAGINLRGIGSGSTLVLLNGRRVAAHPASEAVGSVPVTFFNVNAIPATMINRVEVLRDGASALYGADAVAGVVNFSLYDKFEGAYLSGKYGSGSGTGLDELTLGGRIGWQSESGNTSFTVGGSYYSRSAVQYTDIDDPFFGTLDRRTLVPDPFAGDTDWDNRSTIGPYGRFTSGRLNADGTFTGVRVRRGTTSITNTAGLFHMQPAGFDGGVATTQGIELDDGAQERELRYDFIQDETAIPKTRRTSVAATFSHGLAGGAELFGEALYYDSTVRTQRAPGPFDASLALIIVPATNYWNPFGPTGSVNRLATIDAPAAGLDVLIQGYRPLEMGPRIIEVGQDLGRVLAGVRGDYRNWNWESAVGYSRATVEDEEFNRISKTLLQNSVNLTTPGAFNVFGGPNANSAAVLEAVRVSSIRAGKSTLLSWDASANRSDLFSIWSGDVGAALGIEFRRETVFEDSDPRLDGTIQYTNGAVPDESDLVGVSATNDFGGDRNVWSAYAEFAVPLVAQDAGVPLVHALDLQLAGRFEHFSDFGSVTKPKVALHWFLTPALSVRGSFAQGFLAPNLVQINQGTITRRNQGDADPYRADVTASANDVGDTYRPSLRFGNPNLDPETSDSYSFGIVFAPREGALRGARLSADLWRIKSEDAITVIGVDTQ
ncbi:MAG TPA: TonB-dependent receptor, partial [Steroidobacteraceae bacterium]|nr:TonB-dependent receptor [Steroidobacteraceae bacterium]